MVSNIMSQPELKAQQEQLKDFLPVTTKNTSALPGIASDSVKYTNSPSSISSEQYFQYDLG